MDGVEWHGIAWMYGRKQERTYNEHTTSTKRTDSTWKADDDEENREGERERKKERKPITGNGSSRAAV